MLNGARGEWQLKMLGMQGRGTDQGFMGEMRGRAVERSRDTEKGSKEEPGKGVRGRDELPGLQDSGKG